jgi:hypothetical protein
MGRPAAGEVEQESALVTAGSKFVFQSCKKPVIGIIGCAVGKNVKLFLPLKTLGVNGVAVENQLCHPA